MAVWREVYRVLKPGAHVLAFGGTRTWDLISIGLRFAGFENRDTIADNHPAIQWVYGSGMPKSTNIAMAIDKKLGHKFDPKTWSPISDEAKAVAHLGSGLKPSWEPILVFRKPIKGSLMSNVQTLGTGALNIKGTRVKHASAKDLEDHKKQVEAVRNRGGVRGNSWKNSSDLSGAREVDEGGRWPANFILSHHPECRLVAPESVEGQDTHPRWECHEDCVIVALDRQSGDRPSTLTGRADPNKSHSHPGTEFNSNSTFLGERTHHSNVYADSGGASRFYVQFQEEIKEPFLYTTKANRMEASGGAFEVQHPTLKPLKLMQYLVRLVIPRGGVVLDSFCGSGSTCHAALLEGCSYIGIELGLDGEYDEAVRRMAAVSEVIEDDLFQRDAFDLAMSSGDEDEGPSLPS